MDNEQKIVACVDRSKYAEYAADYAAWAACRTGAPLELLHVIDLHPEVARTNDHSGAIGFDAQEHLLSELSEKDESRSRVAREQGRIFLNGLRERVLAAGVESPDVRQRNGHLEETANEIEDDVCLFVLGRLGRSAEYSHRDLGRNVESVVRNVNKPVLTVTESFTEPQRVLIAYDGSAVCRRAVELVAGNPLFRGLAVQVLTAGKPRRESRKQLDWAGSTLEAAGMAVSTAMTPGDPERVITRAIRDQQIDLLVMGAYSHSPLRSLFLGSKTSGLLRAATIPTLLVR